MVLQSDRIILRKFKKEDVPEYLEIVNDESIEKYVPYGFAKDLSECTELIDCYSAGDFLNDFYFIIEHSKTHQIIGSLLCVRTVRSTISISYLIGKDYRGNGFIMEALNLFIDYLSKNTNYQYLAFSIDFKNTASQKIMEKIKAPKYSVHNNFIHYLYRIKSAN